MLVEVELRVDKLRVDKRRRQGTRASWVLAYAAVSVAVCSGACSPAAVPVEGAPPVVSVRPQDGSAAAEVPPARPRLHCPPAKSRGEGYPPWELQHRFDECISGPAGRWTVMPDKSDPGGWRHFLTFEGNNRRWKLTVISPLAMALRRDGHLVLVDLKDGISLIAPGGAVVWRESYPRCGAIKALAVGYDDTISFTCGYSLLRFDARGKLLWQKWPFGNEGIGGLWVDRAGTLIASGAGKVRALKPDDGTALWTVDTGFNRAVGSLVWSRAGNLVFDTSMAALHSSDGEYRFYYDHEPPELFEVTPTGALVSRRRHDGKPPEGGWPAVLPLPEDGSHRLP